MREVMGLHRHHLSARQFLLLLMATDLPMHELALRVLRALVVQIV
jgi:hypothetical protein